MINKEDQPPMVSMLDGIVKRAGHARRELSEVLQCPAVWPEILAAVKQLKEENAHYHKIRDSFVDRLEQGR